MIGSLFRYVSLRQTVNAVIVIVCMIITCVPPSWAQGNQADKVKLLILGDSLSAGYGLEASQSFPAQLQAAFDQKGINVSVINAGVSGDTTSGGLARLDWALADNPKAVLVELGANDGLRGIDPSLSKANLEQMIVRLKQAKVPVLLAGMLAPPNLGADYGAQFKAIYHDLAQDYKIGFYPFFLDGVAGRPDLNQDDGIHPNPQGVALVVENIFPYVIETLAQIPPENLSGKLNLFGDK